MKTTSADIKAFCDHSPSAPDWNEMTTYKTDRDNNGNRIVRVTVPGSRAFTIQTNGNLPETHRQGVCSATPGEVSAYVRQFGTARQRQLLGI